MTDTRTTAHIPNAAVQAPERIRVAQDAEGFWTCREAISGSQEYIRSDLAFAHLPAPCAVEVKKLEWSQKAPALYESEPFLYWAIGIGGHYRAEPDGTLWMAHDPFIFEKHKNQSAAKAAAQADFERRILSCVVTKPVDVAAVREAEAVIEWNGEEVTAAAMISVIAEFLRANGKAVLLPENSLGKQILEFKLAAENLRALSAEPAQGEQWKSIETAPKDTTEIIVLCGQKDIRLGWYFAPSSQTFGWFDQRQKKINPTHWMPLPAAPTTEAGE